MADNQHSDIFSSTECLSIDTMEKYANDQLNDADRLSVEKHLVDCAICSDALEGLTLAGFSSDTDARISSLNDRIASQTQMAKSGIWKRQYTSYAAAILGIMVVSGLLLNYLKTSDIAQPKYISEEIDLETPVPQSDNTAIAREQVPTEKSKEDKGLAREPESSVAAGDAFDVSGFVDDDLDGARLKDEAENKEAILAGSLEISDKIENSQSSSLTAERQTMVDGKFSTISTEDIVLAEDEEVDNRRSSTTERTESRNLGKEKDKLFKKGEKLSKNQSTNGAAGGLTTKSEDYYRADNESIDELKQEAKPEETQSGKPRVITAGTTTTAVQQSKADRALTKDESKKKSSGKAKPNKTGYNSAKGKTPEFAESERDRKAASLEEEAAAAEKTLEEEGKRLTEYDVSNTLGSETMKEATGEQSGEYAFESGVSAPTTTEPVVNEPNDVLMDSVSLDADLVTLPADQDPSFQGGEAKLQTYLKDNVVYPDSAKQLGLNCKVNVQFTVNADSTISDATIVKPVGGACDKEALRVVKKMPNWNPAQSNGKKVARQYNLEIDFESIKD